MILVAKEFNQLPSVVERAMAEDSSSLDVRSLPLLRYADRHAAMRRANKKELDGLKSDRLMQLVNENEAALVRSEIEAQS